MAKLNERSWTNEQLLAEFPKANSIHDLANKLGLVSVTTTLKRVCKELNLDLKSLKRKYSRYNVDSNKLSEIIKNSLSYRQVLSKLGIAPAGGNYTSLKKRIKKYNIDISHFTGQSWNKGINFGPKRPIEDYLSNKYSISSHKLRLRLIKEKFLKAKCNSCKKTTWLNKSIALELHHKDGNHENNNLSNLELLCPNCHAYTDTYRGKNQERKNLSPPHRAIIYYPHGLFTC